MFDSRSDLVQQFNSDARGGASVRKLTSNIDMAFVNVSDVHLVKCVTPTKVKLHPLVN